MKIPSSDGVEGGATLKVKVNKLILIKMCVINCVTDDG